MKWSRNKIVAALYQIFILSDAEHEISAWIMNLLDFHDGQRTNDDGRGTTEIFWFFIFEESADYWIATSNTSNKFVSMLIYSVDWLYIIWMRIFNICSLAKHRCPFQLHHVHCSFAHVRSICLHLWKTKQNEAKTRKNFRFISKDSNCFLPNFPSQNAKKLEPVLFDMAHQHLHMHHQNGIWMNIALFLWALLRFYDLSKSQQNTKNIYFFRIR